MSRVRPDLIALGLFLSIGSVYDVRQRRVPNWLSLSCFVAWIGFRVAGLGPELGLTILWEGLIALPLLGISLFRPTGFGMGDVKVVALVTLFLGEGVLVVVVVACFLSLLAVLVRRVWAVEGLPFVPFLTAGAMATLSS